MPFLADIFSIVPLSLNEWALVLAYSLPVIFIDEVQRGGGQGGRACDWELKDKAGSPFGRPCMSRVAV